MIDLTNEQLTDLADACACAEILWRKRRMHTKGLIDFGCPNVWDEEFCTHQMKHYRKLWNEISLLVVDD